MEDDVTEGSDSRSALHLLPVDLGRGAQRYATSLRSELSGRDWEHRILVLFRSERRAVEADESLDVVPGLLRRSGFDPRVVWRLRRRLRRLPPDVVIAHGGEPYKYARLAVPAETKLVYHRIGVSQRQVTSGVRRIGSRWLARRADMVSGVSHETLDDSHEIMGVPRDRLRLVPNGRDPVPFRLARARAESRTDMRPHLISVGHLSEGKRPGWFLDLVDRLRSDGRDIRATLVGDGPLQERLAAQARAGGVAVLGHRDDVPDLLSEADVFCFTSSGESEGMPGVLIEAGLAGLATVATSVAGASTVIDDEHTGYITPVDDFEAFVRATVRLVDDGELCSATGQAARDRCEALFTLEASATRFQEAVDELVDGPRREERQDPRRCVRSSTTH